VWDGGIRRDIIKIILRVSEMSDSEAMVMYQFSAVYRSKLNSITLEGIRFTQADTGDVPDFYLPP
jgi:hypothetical protein